MKHITTLTRAPHQAQTEEFSLAAIFTLLSDILFAVSTAVIAKESSNLTDLSGLLGGTGTTTS